MTRMLFKAFEDRRGEAVRVAVVDDSLFIRRAFARLLDGEPGVELVGSAGRGEELLSNLLCWRPDLIILDLANPLCPPALLLLGASAGGPPAIERVLHDLGPRLSLPVLVAQHMPPGFTRAFASRLTAYLPLEVREAADGEPLLPGRVYVAPGGFHTAVQMRPCGLLRAVLTATEDRVQPSIDILFSSAASALGPQAAAALLTGMGEDGALGMGALALAGAYTIAQDETSSTVFGMPRAAIAAGAVRETLPLSSIGSRLRQLAALPHGNVPAIESVKELEPQRALPSRSRASTIPPSRTVGQ